MKPLEAFIVLAVILVLWSTWAVNGIGIPLASRHSACQKNLGALEEALEAWAKDHDGAYPTRLSELVPGYLRGIPACPGAGRDTYSESYRGGPAFRVYCLGEHHDRRAMADHPRLVSGEDLDPGWVNKPARYRPLFPIVVQGLMVLALAWWGWQSKRSLPRLALMLTFTLWQLGLAWEIFQMRQAQRGLSQCMESLRAEGLARENRSSEEFTIVCPGHDHGPDMTDPGYPLYSSRLGLIERPR